jgi:predicted RNA-binding protein (virulence factor B family)
VGFVRRVREDGRLDISLLGGRKAQNSYDQQVLQYLHEQDGFIALHDKSDPADIERVLGMSKKSFKRAISALYKARKIRIEDDGIYAAQ